MLSLYLKRFNLVLKQFQQKFPRPYWTNDFKSDLINDFAFFSAKAEDEKLI